MYFNIWLPIPFPCDVCKQSDDKEEAEEVRQARRALELLELAKKEAQVCSHHQRWGWVKGRTGFWGRRSQFVALASLDDTGY